MTDNLRTACAKTGRGYERLLRPALRHRRRGDRTRHGGRCRVAQQTPRARCC
ncbi:MAG: hypothetical protein ACLR4Z_03275 [Butyricicoccaceae bacterium]